jgi:hypothetical protein
MQLGRRAAWPACNSSAAFGLVGEGLDVAHKVFEMLRHSSGFTASASRLSAMVWAKFAIATARTSISRAVARASARGSSQDLYKYLVLGFLVDVIKFSSNKIRLSYLF